MPPPSTDPTPTGIPLAPSLQTSLDSNHIFPKPEKINVRIVFISILSIGIAIASGFIAQFLILLINIFTGIFFYHSLSFSQLSPSNNTLGFSVIIVPIIGGIIVGIMARYGSQGIRGHGIPEAMENVLTNQSKIPPRLTFLKPLSAAISIGTGGPFGAEGPIIATGGALGSLVGQLLKTTADERKTLLAAGAAAGMAATFGSPISAVLIAIELLLFEFRSRSIIPVALAAAAATGVRTALVGSAPIFGMSNFAEPSTPALLSYIIIGAVIGIASVGVTTMVYLVEDMFEKIPVHWMWWPALGAIAVGIIGFFVPKTMGVGYDNIQNILHGSFGLTMLAILCTMKFLSWAISLGSGTSGGTLAPLFTIGGALGAFLGMISSTLFPSLGIDPRVAALVGMAGMFSGASRALLASVVFAFETTLQPSGLLPLLGGCTASYFVSVFLMKNTIMTEKIVRRGIKVPSDYAADFLDMMLVKDFCTKNVICLKSKDTVFDVKKWMLSNGEDAEHQGFPVIDEQEHLVGVVTRRDIFGAEKPAQALLASLIQKPPVAIYEDGSLREAADHMIIHNVGRLPVIERVSSKRIVGIITRSDILSAHHRRLHESKSSESGIIARMKLRMQD